MGDAAANTSSPVDTFAALPKQPCAPPAAYLRIRSKELTPKQEKALHRNLIKHFASIGCMAREIDQVHPWRSTVARTADAVSIADMLDEMFGKESSLERRWFEFTLANDNCADVSKQSSLGLLASVSAARMGSDEQGVMGYWLSSETHRCPSGNDLLAAPQPAAAGPPLAHGRGESKHT